MIKPQTSPSNHHECPSPPNAFNGLASTDGRGNNGAAKTTVTPVAMTVATTMATTILTTVATTLATTAVITAVEVDIHC